MSAHPGTHLAGGPAAEVVRLDDGSVVLVRPISPTDAGRLGRMFHRLSPETVYRRFFAPVHRPSNAALRHLATVDHHRREALVALKGDEVVGVARWDVPSGSGRDEAEIAVTVEDAWQNRGLGSVLVDRLAARAARRGIAGFSATILAENRGVVRFLRRRSPRAEVRFDGGELRAYAPVAPPEPRPGRSSRR